MAQKKKILVTGRLPDEVMAQLSADCDMEANREDRPMEREQVLKRIADREGLLSMITDRVDAELMDSAPNLKVISNLAVGYNNIDVAAATARGIAVGNEADPNAAAPVFTYAPTPAGDIVRNVLPDLVLLAAALTNGTNVLLLTAPQAPRTDHTLTVIVPEAEEALAPCVTKANELGIKIRSVDMREPNLEAVFLHLTGRALRD